jgi:putative alpha-1,2-mannosidase
VRAAADAPVAAAARRASASTPTRASPAIFYGALYRTLLHPSDIADADGRVRGPTGEVMAAHGRRRTTAR